MICGISFLGRLTEAIRWNRLPRLTRRKTTPLLLVSLKRALTLATPEGTRRELLTLVTIRAASGAKA